MHSHQRHTNTTQTCTNTLYSPYFTHIVILHMIMDVNTREHLTSLLKYPGLCHASLTKTRSFCFAMAPPNGCPCPCSAARSCPTLAIPWTVACLTPLSMGFSQQKYWGGLPCSLPGDLPNPGIESASPALQANSLPLSH